LQHQLIKATITDGEHEYEYRIIIVSATYDSWEILARRYFKDFFGAETKADEQDWRRFWSPEEDRVIKIEDATCLTEAEFDFLKHFLHVSTVPT